MSNHGKHEPYIKFKLFLEGRGITYDDVGKLLDITATTVKMKVEGGSDFYLSEQERICKVFGLTPDIFFE